MQRLALIEGADGERASSLLSMTRETVDVLSTNLAAGVDKSSGAGTVRAGKDFHCSPSSCASLFFLPISFWVLFGVDPPSPAWEISFLLLTMRSTSSLM